MISLRRGRPVPELDQNPARMAVLNAHNKFPGGDGFTGVTFGAQMEGLNLPQCFAACLDGLRRLS